MNTQDTRNQQMFKIRRTTLGFGVVQILLGASLTALSFTAFALTTSDRIRNACPYWAGFAVFWSGGVGIIAWKHSSVMSMSLFTFFSAVCVVLQMIGTILTGDAGGLLRSLVMCEKEISGPGCKCCASVMGCHEGVGVVEFEGVHDCSVITGLLTGLLYGLCVLTIFGSLLCFIATILGCTAVARQTSRNQGLCSRYSSRRSHASRSPESYTWADCSTDLTMLPPYAPPVYHSVDNFQEYGLSSCIVPPPVFDPTDLPPPYSSQNPSLAESRNSLTSPESSNNLPQSSETDVHFQPMRSSHQAGNYNEELRASAREECNLHDRGAPWDGHLNAMSDSSDLLTASASSDLSSNCNRSFSDQQTNANDTDMYKTVLIGATPLLNHPAKSRIQAEFSELDEASPGSRRRTSSLQETLTKESTHTRNVPAVSRSPARGTPLLSLRTRSRSLGENAIYVNSFEVMARPPPNVRLPADEQLKTSNTAGHVTTRNTHRRTRKGMTLKGDSSKDHNSNRSEQRKEKVKKRRRRHSHSISRHKERWNANCESLNSQVNRGNDDSVTPGKETVV